MCRQADAVLPAERLRVAAPGRDRTRAAAASASAALWRGFPEKRLRRSRHGRGLMGQLKQGLILLLIAAAMFAGMVYAAVTYVGPPYPASIGG
jgi:hypothetical protein